MKDLASDPEQTFLKSLHSGQQRGTARLQKLLLHDGELRPRGKGKREGHFKAACLICEFGSSKANRSLYFAAHDAFWLSPARSGTLIEDSANIPLPQFQLFGNGVLDLSNVLDKTMTIGSLAGAGLVLLAGHGLEVGHNNLSASFSGVIQDSGHFVKSGTGTLTLNEASTYAGGTTLSAGTLRVNNQTASGPGAGKVKVEGGTLAGQGSIAGAVTSGPAVAQEHFWHRVPGRTSR